MPSRAETGASWLVCGALLLCVLAFYVRPLWPAGLSGTFYIAIHALMSAAMVVAWRNAHWDVRRLLWAGVAIRLALIPVMPISSNDSERYLWDGAVALAGFDPYSTAPDNPAVEALRAIWPTPEEHAQYATIYPPAALALFAGSAIAGPDWGVFVWQIIAGLAGIGTVAVMGSVLRHYGRERHFALVALSPLLILETGIGAHLDAVLVFGFVLVLWSFAKKRWSALGLALGWSVCLKFLPLAVLAPLAFAVPLRGVFKVVSVCFATIAAIYGLALAIGLTPIGILPTFFAKWRGGSPVFALLEAMLAGPVLIAVLGMLAAAGVLGAMIAARKGYFHLGCIIVLSVPLVLSPVVFPWYLMILVPLLALRPGWTLGLWVTTAPLGYEVLNGWLDERVWDPQSWPLFAIAAGWIIGAYLDRRAMIHASREFPFSSP